MSRMRAFREGVPTEDGRVVAPKGVDWEEPVPIMNNETPLPRPIGRLVKIRRERDGWVTGQVEGIKISKGWALQASIVSPPGEEIDPVAVRGRLVHVVVGDRPVWPGMAVR